MHPATTPAAIPERLAAGSRVGGCPCAAPGLAGDNPAVFGALVARMQDEQTP
jgi:hypothetical protein